MIMTSNVRSSVQESFSYDPFDPAVMADPLSYYRTCATTTPCTTWTGTTPTRCLDSPIDDLIELARNVDYPDGAAIDDPVVREALADMQARVIAKLAYTELNVAICRYAVELAASGDLRPEGDDVYARWRQGFLWSRALTISGGWSEIVRNVLATQMFGFPKSW
jgi:alkylation response protein AidB-like acyl-CoA dehydrogenase